MFLAWVCFSVAFTAVFQAFLTTLLTESGYKITIRSTDALLATGIGLAYPEDYSAIFEKLDGTESLQFQRNHMSCPSFDVCVDRAKYHKNMSIILLDKFAEVNYALGEFVGENSEPLLCKLEDGLFISFGQSMLMFHGDPLMRRVNEIIDRVV